MTARVLHVSDLHLGRREAPETLAALAALTTTLAPELVVASGDLAHRGRRSQLERAAEFLEGLDTPVLAVPGNHDIPYTFPARLTRPYAEWERAFGTVEPVFTSERLTVVGTTSVRPWGHQGGAVCGARLATLVARLSEAQPGALRVVVLHHHLAAPPWRAARKRPLRGRARVLAALADAGADLVVGGHVHQASIAEPREFQATDGGRARTLVLATAPGLGRPRPRRPGEAQGVNVYESNEGTLTVLTLAWSGRSFVEVGRRSFRRGESELEVK